MAIQVNGTSGISGVDGSAGTPAIQGTDTNTGISFGTDEVNLNTGGTTRATVDSSGRLLVGTTSVSSDSTAVLVGRSDGATSAPNLRLEADFTPADGNSLGALLISQTGQTGQNASARIEVRRDGGTWTSGSSMPGRLEFRTTADGAASPTERMRIKSDGGTHIYGRADIICAARSNYGAGAVYLLFQGAYSASGTIGTGTESYRVFTNGNVQNTNNSYGAISDIKLKENIVDASSQWDDLKAIQVRNYNFKEGQTHTQIGVVAQEVELVSPGLVYESPDRDEDGNDLGTTTKAVNYSVLYMKAVKALQEAMERIETLETANASLEARLTALEGGAN